ncbi:MAG: sigma-54 dependent transcriptional regulator [Spirochaetaceae bacterium]|nr:sigma-54 dependent transcriptional regulator [Spirochaetaceae bacterium]
MARPSYAAAGERPILVVDDEVDVLESTELLLFTLGLHNVVLCADGTRVMRLLDEHDPRLILLDLAMPGASGQEILERLRLARPDIPVVVVTGTNDVAVAVQCMKLGAYDFVLKPLEQDAFAQAVGRALEQGSLRAEISRLKHRLIHRGLEHPEAFARIATNNATMLALFSYLEAIAPSPEPVLITGESGVGKELFADALHRLSGRGGALVAVNLAGLDDTLFSDALFGHRKGAFTGAAAERRGMIERAAGGTLLLDEIGDLSTASQVKLLRLLQEREYYPLGSDVPRRAAARVVAATHQDLAREVEAGTFRRDLFYRLNTHSVHVPPLRERQDDLPLLVACFVEEAARSRGRGAVEVGGDVVARLARHPFPGNVRELRSLIIDAVYRVQGDVLSAGDLAALPGATATDPPPAEPPAGGPDLRFGGRLPQLKEIGDLLAAEALRRTGGNQSRAAALLGVSHQALSKRLRSRRGP